ncbi:nuclease-related domain-containing protein [Anaerotalea alkaliphila]|uniref:NERD domain-containing protein n=1 Tax=Anaerotalea alkaliphila TaxID=2662126 RepID=A0A7X5HVC0_9FIRM|nr:nuclease-related domain-containing protein [Anaerotalea alkaliphila]NDL67310.1 NERD domain-containing protein [Anaerotalea alkaliphila]
MAEIIKRSNHLRQDINRTKKELAAGVLATAISLLLLEVSQGFSIYIGIAALLHMVRLINDLEILQFGLKGENEVLSLLEKLPRNYKVFSDIHIVDGSKSSQIDFVIVGFNGLFIMETKHIKGTITGREEDNYLQKVKIGKNGERYTKRIFNPLKQIQGHKKGMDLFLERSGIHQEAVPMLFFSSDCIMHVKSKRVKVITEPVQVIDYIKRYRREDVHLSSSIQEHVVEALERL